MQLWKLWPKVFARLTNFFAESPITIDKKTFFWKFFLTRKISLSLDTRNTILTTLPKKLTPRVRNILGQIWKKLFEFLFFSLWFAPTAFRVQFWKPCGTFVARSLKKFRSNPKRVKTLVSIIFIFKMFLWHVEWSFNRTAKNSHSKSEII